MNPLLVDPTDVHNSHPAVVVQIERNDILAAEATKSKPVCYKIVLCLQINPSVTE